LACIGLSGWGIKKGIDGANTRYNREHLYKLKTKDDEDSHRRFIELALLNARLKDQGALDKTNYAIKSNSTQPPYNVLDAQMHEYNKNEQIIKHEQHINKLIDDNSPD